MRILVHDNGLCTELAITLARAGHSVTYHTPWTNAFPKASQAFIGKGLEGIELAENFTDALMHCDMLVCPDTFSADYVKQGHLAGKRVFGAGQAERMELDRPWMKEQQARLGLPVGTWRKVPGLTKLLDLLQMPEFEGWWVKTSKYRQLETFCNYNWETTRNTVLGDLLNCYGAIGDDIEFILEKPLKSKGMVEVGIDGLFTFRRWQNSGYGYEAKDQAYIGRVGPLPPLLQRYAKALTQPLAYFDANSFVSNEVIVLSENEHYQIEPTIRCPHPPTAGMLEMYENIDKMVLLVEGEQLKPATDYCAVLVLVSTWAEEHWTEITFDQKYRQQVKLSQACKRGGKYYAVPGNAYIGYCVGIGPSAHTAVLACKTVARTVKARELEVHESALDKILEETIPAGKKVGISF